MKNRYIVVLGLLGVLAIGFNGCGGGGSNPPQPWPPIPTVTPTFIPVPPTVTPTAVPTSTLVPTETPTLVPTAVSTNTPTPLPTDTPTPTPTATPIPTTPFLPIEISRETSGGSTYDNWVIQNNGRYIQFHCQNTADPVYRDRIWRSESPNGLTGWFNKYKVVEGTSETAQDDLSCSPGVAIAPTGVWHMYYVTAARASVCTIEMWHAISPDGVTWTKLGKIAAVPVSDCSLVEPSPVIEGNKIAVYFPANWGSPTFYSYLWRMESDITDGHTFSMPVRMVTPPNFLGGRVSKSGSTYYLAYSSTTDGRNKIPDVAYLSVSTGVFPPEFKDGYKVLSADPGKFYGSQVMAGNYFDSRLYISGNYLPTCDTVVPPTPCRDYPNTLGVIINVPAWTPTATPTPTATYSHTPTAIGTPTPCTSQPGPGGFDPCPPTPTATPGGPTPVPTSTPTVTATPTKCYTFNGATWVPCDPTPVPTAGSTPTPTATPTRTLPPAGSPTPCIPQPGPGGIDPCPTPTPGIPPFSTPTPVPTSPIPTPTPTAVPTITPGGPTPTPTPVSVAGTVGLAGAPVKFEPAPPGAQRPITLSSGFTNLEMLYKRAGAPRLLNQESFGYSVLMIDTPTSPFAVNYQDMRFGTNRIPAAGDGQSYTYGTGTSPDGQRIAVGLGGPGDGWGTAVGSPDGGDGFIFFGSYGLDRPTGVAVQKAGGRYLSYSASMSSIQVCDVTNLPTDLVAHNMDAVSETNPAFSGYLLKSIGNYVMVLNPTIGAIQVINASSPGPIGAIFSTMTSIAITSVDFGGRAIQYYTAALDPADATKLWVLVELRAGAGENSPSYGLLSISSSMAKTSAGPVWRVPSVAGESYGVAGVSAALATNNGSMYALIPTVRFSPSQLFRIYSASVANWNTKGSFDIPSTIYSTFSFNNPMVIYSGPNNLGYAYLPTGSSAWMIPLAYK